MSRVYAAPRELVFEAWTDPRHLAKWWGPNGFTTTTHAMDFRPGGAWRFIMHGPDGTDFPNKIVYTEIVRPERLAYDHGSDDDGPPLFQVTVTFDERDGQTTITMCLMFPTAAIRNMTVEKSGAIEGGNQTLARLADYVSTM